MKGGTTRETRSNTHHSPNSSGRSDGQFQSSCPPQPILSHNEILVARRPCLRFSSSRLLFAPTCTPDSFSLSNRRKAPGNPVSPLHLSVVLSLLLGLAITTFPTSSPVLLSEAGFSSVFRILSFPAYLSYQPARPVQSLDRPMPTPDTSRQRQMHREYL